MTTQLEELKQQLVDLPHADRAWLVQELIGSLDHEVDPDWEQSWLVEVKRRSAELDSGAVTCVSADEALARIDTRLQCPK